MVARVKPGQDEPNNYIRNTSNLVRRIGALSAADSASANTRRVSAGGHFGQSPMRWASMVMVELIGRPPEVPVVRITLV